MKTIVYRGGVVTFRIPAHWREEYSDMDGGTFYENQSDSGTLRLKILTFSVPKKLRTFTASDLLQVPANDLKKLGVEGSTRDRADGNAVFKYEESGFERGEELIVFYWVIANPLPPRHARVATFSYTILAEQRAQEHVRRDLEMLEAEIEAATFYPGLGVVAE